LLALVVAGPAAADEVIATLNGQPIYLSEIEQNAAFQVWRLRSSIYSLMESEARQIADGRLLSEEAARQGLTVEALLKRRRTQRSCRLPRRTWTTTSPPTRIRRAEVPGSGTG
jgi:hypothetical protein